MTTLFETAERDAGQLRPYQQDVAVRARLQMRQGGRRGIIQGETGSGKTYVIAHLASLAARKGSRVLILADRRRLVRQVGGTLSAFGLSYGVIMADETGHLHENCIVASRDTLAAWNRYGREPIPFDLILIDECHKAMGEVYQSILALYPQTHVIGFTATPARGDGKSLGAFFQWIECTVPASQLIREGWLVKPEVYAPLELAQQRKKGATTRGLSGDPVQHWKRHADGLPTIAFAANIGESVALRDRFQEAGIPAEHVDGTDEDSEREAKYDRLQSGRTLVLCSVDLLIEGVDFPGVAAAILWKKFGSLVQYRQGCGRIMRPAKGKSRAVVLDHAGAAGVHGLPGDDVEWSLDENSTVDGRRKRAIKDGRQETVVVCLQCGLAFSGEPCCPACQWKPKHRQKPTAAKQIHEARDEVLSRYEGDGGHVAAETRQRHWMSCLYMAAARKSVLGAAAAMFSKKFGVPPWTCGVKPLPDDLGAWRRPVVEVFPQFDKRGKVNA